ncbi:MAG TPA: condensation domain-containing protein, partial [Candidatus Kapabacteria bacterium]|nr:condensation domain-containing protein [Candidatus Kapabacteria bacterium]
MVTIAKLDRKNIADIYALTPLQQGMLFHYLQEPGSDLYFEQLSLELDGDIDLNIFEAAWNFVVKTNEVLRTVFRWEKGNDPVQVALKEYILKPAYYDLSGENSPCNQVEELKAKDRAKKFDLQEIPFRIVLAKLAERQYAMIISNHHILYDGWSSGIILKEFFSAYFELLRGGKPAQPAKNKFKEFVKWVYSRDTGAQKKFWQNYLDGFDSPVEFSQRRRKENGPRSTGEYSLTWNTGFKEELENFTAPLRVTLA